MDTRTNTMVSQLSSFPKKARRLASGVRAEMTDLMNSKVHHLNSHMRNSAPGDLPATEPIHRPSQNHLLAALPADEFEPLAAHLKLVPLRLGDMLYEPGGKFQHAYFPTTAIVSLHYVMESGASAETANVGNEGVVGIALCMGGGAPFSSAVVRTAGHAYQLHGRVLQREFDRGGAMQNLMLRYTQALIAQMVLTAACNRFHSIEEQLCRVLLSTLDRGRAREVVMTQELVARMLGVRREGVTAAAVQLQKAGCIRYRRGHITVTDRDGLEARACECYAVARKEMSRLLGKVHYRQGTATGPGPLPEYAMRKS